MKGIQLVFALLSAPGFVYLLHLAAKLFVVHKICTHSELSEEKVKHITSMFNTDNNEF